MAFVYIIKSEKDNSFYIGSTEDFKKRLREHNFGRTGYTSKKRPWKLVYIKEFKTLKEAIKEERRLKKYKNKKYLAWLINNQKQRGP